MLALNIITIISCCMKIIDSKQFKVNINKRRSYCVVSAYADDLNEFADYIDRLIDKEGWLIAGSLSASNSMLYQALTKYER